MVGGGRHSGSVVTRVRHHARVARATHLSAGARMSPTRRPRALYLCYTRGWVVCLRLRARGSCAWACGTRALLARGWCREAPGAQRTRARATVAYACATKFRWCRELSLGGREAARRAAALQHAATRRRSAGQLVSAPVGRGAAASAASVGGPCRGASGRATAHARRLEARRTCGGRREKAAGAREATRKP